MPKPRPAYHPTFAVADVATLVGMVRKPPLAHRLVQRAKLALLLHRQPAIASAAAARQLGQHPNWVRTWRKRGATTGFSVAALADQPRSGRPPTVSPLAQATVKAIAWALPAQRDQPLSRSSLADRQQVVSADPAVGPLSRSTVWRILDRDPLKPWRFRMWIFPRDPAFAEQAGRVVDLQSGWWEGRPLGAHDYVLGADEKTSIQARCRCAPSRPIIPGQPQQVEFESERPGAVQYLAAWDVRRGLVCGRCEGHTGIVPFGRLVAQVMEQEPARSAARVFWIVDTGSAQRGAASVRRLTAQYPNLVLVHLPVHAGWLNHIELDCSILQRTVLTPNDFPNCAAVERRLLAFAQRSNAAPRPFAWRFTRADLDRRLREHAAPAVPLPEAA